MKSKTNPLENKTERELLEMQVDLSIKNEKHLKSIEEIFILLAVIVILGIISYFMILIFTIK